MPGPLDCIKYCLGEEKIRRLKFSNIESRATFQAEIRRLKETFFIFVTEILSDTVSTFKIDVDGQFIEAESHQIGERFYGKLSDPRSAFQKIFGSTQ